MVWRRRAGVWERMSGGGVDSDTWVGHASMRTWQVANIFSGFTVDGNRAVTVHREYPSSFVGENERGLACVCAQSFPCLHIVLHFVMLVHRPYSFTGTLQFFLRCKGPRGITISKALFDRSHGVQVVPGLQNGVDGYDDTRCAKAGFLQYRLNEFYGWKAPGYPVHGLRNQVRPPKAMKELMMAARVDGENPWRTKDPVGFFDDRAHFGKRLPMGVGDKVMQDLIAHDTIETVISIGERVKKISLCQGDI